MSAAFTETLRSLFPEQLAAPAGGPWEVVPRGDGRFAVRRAGAGFAVLHGPFETTEEAATAAREMNAQLPKSATPRPAIGLRYSR